MGQIKPNQSDSRDCTPGHPVPQSKQDFRWFSDTYSKTRLQVKKLDKEKKGRIKKMQLWSYICAKAGTQIGLWVF